MRRRLPALLVLLVLTSPAMAQTAQTVRTTNVLQQIDRQRETITSISVDVGPDETGDISVQLNIPDTAEYEDTRNKIRVTSYALIDGVWEMGPGGIWEGGPKVSKTGVVNPPFRVSFKAFEPLAQWQFLGHPMRVEIEVFRPIRVGVSVLTRTP